MTDPVSVWISEGAGVRAGQLYSHRRRGNESASFTYDHSYLSRTGAYALDPQLTLATPAHHTASQRRMFGAFGDCAPDRWGRMLLTQRESRLARDQGRAPRSLGEIDFLLGVRDDLRQGALRFSHADGEFLATPTDGVPALTDLPELLELADLAERDAATLPDLQRLFHAGGSLGGARPKAHVMSSDRRLALAKFPSADRDTWDVMAWEHVLLRLAESAGIVVPRSELLSLAGRSVLVIDRFDRLYGDRDQAPVRVGYVSAMTMLEEADGERASYIDIAAAVEEHSDHATEDLEQLWRRALFNVATGNTDDHLRNHGFLHVAPRDAWRLSPAFDMNPTPTPGPQHHQTSIDGSDAPATVAAVLAVAGEFRLTSADADRIAAEVLGAVTRWESVAGAAGLTKRQIGQMAPAFEVVA